MRGPWFPSPTAMTVLVSLIVATGCASLGGSDDLTGSGDSPMAARTTWDYLPSNASDATFTGCTGDAAVLEGQTLVDGMALAPLCMIRGTFDVVTDGAVFTAVPFNVACSDGSSGLVTGGGVFLGSSFTGSWQTDSTSGVTGTHAFSGVHTGGNLLVLDETLLTFGGSFQGTCSLSPALNVSAAIR